MVDMTAVVFIGCFWLLVLATIELKRWHKILKPIQEVCEKYRIPIDDLPEVLEEYIEYDNEEYLEKLRNQ